MTNERFNTIIFILLFIVSFVFAIIAVNQKVKYRQIETKYNTEICQQKDSIIYYSTKCESYDKLIREYTNCGDSLMFKLDSLSSINDSLSNNLYVALFKLERIKYYNQIAANGNNITFLRGWINRVLNEE